MTTATMLISPCRPVMLRSSPVRRVLEVGQAGEDRRQASQPRARPPRSRRLEAVDAEERAQHVQQDRDGRAAHHHVDQDCVQRVAEPRAVEEVLQQLAGSARAADRRRWITAGDAVPQPVQGPPSLKHLDHLREAIRLRLAGDLDRPFAEDSHVAVDLLVGVLHR